MTNKIEAGAFLDQQQLFFIFLRFIVLLLKSEHRIINHTLL